MELLRQNNRMTRHDDMDTNLMKEPGNNVWSHLGPAPLGSHVHEVEFRGWSSILLLSHHYADVKVSNTAVQNLCASICLRRSC